MNLIKNVWKIKEGVPFMEYFNIPLKDFHLAQIIQLNGGLIKRIFLFIKSIFSGKCDKLKQFRNQILEWLFNEYIKELKINDKNIDIDHLFEKSKNVDVLLFNLMKMKIFYEIWYCFELEEDILIQTFLIKDHQSLRGVIGLTGNIRFYQKILEKIFNNQEKVKESKFNEEIQEILRSFYWRLLFMKLTYSDLVIMKKNTYICKISFLQDSFYILRDFFKANFAMFNFLKTPKEMIDFNASFSKLTSDDFFEVINVIFP